MWTMAWEAHAVEFDAGNFFNANIFYPEQGTLAYAPLNLAPMLLEYPILRASRNPILAYNFVYLFSWALIGFGAFLLARKMGIGFASSLVAGTLAEISPFSYSQIGHLEILWIGWIPLFFIAAHNLVQGGAKQDYFLAMIFFLLQSLTSCEVTNDG